jgi:hypothetical protein
VTSPDVIAGVDRISHEAIEDFIRRADKHLDAEADMRPTTTAFLDDAVMNLRQLLAEHALLTRERDELRAAVPATRTADLRSSLADWTDFDGAEFEVARCLGIMDPAASWSPTLHKYLFWSNNPVGNGLHEILECLVAMGAIKTNEDCQYRWNSSFDCDRAARGPEGEAR